MSKEAPRFERGPFRADQIAPGDRHELSNGNAFYCAPTGGDGARGAGAGFEVIDTDPAVQSAGMDPGYATAPNTLRAPDVAVGVPDAPGWITGAPPLALEYASVGQDEEQLQRKISDLLEAGTRWVWVVRLLGPRRVEVYERGQPVQTRGPGSVLVAPGVLQNPVPVEALYDRNVAHEIVLRNLLQRRGYDGLEAVRAEGRAGGKAEAVLALVDARKIQLSDEGRKRIAESRDVVELDRWLARVVTAASELELLR
jgi:hypothetical protein